MVQNTAINKFNYSGEVKLSIYDDNELISSRKIKNSGTDFLFDFFAYSLMGEFDKAKLYRPTKILLQKIYYDTDGAVEECAPASGFIYLRTKPQIVYKDETESRTVKLSFVVPRTAISNTEFNRVCLFADCMTYDEQNSYSAFCNLDTSSDLMGGTTNISSWSLSTVLMIDWELTISNKITQVA
jgi:hypothetical protein